VSGAPGAEEPDGGPPGAPLAGALPAGALAGDHRRGGAGRDGADVVVARVLVRGRVQDQALTNLERQADAVAALAPVPAGQTRVARGGRGRPFGRCGAAGPPVGGSPASPARAASTASSTPRARHRRAGASWWCARAGRAVGRVQRHGRRADRRTRDRAPVPAFGIARAEVPAHRDPRVRRRPARRRGGAQGRGRGHRAKRRSGWSGSCATCSISASSNAAGSRSRPSPSTSPTWPSVQTSGSPAGPGSWA
jgi:hypothetical protein